VFCLFYNNEGIILQKMEAGLFRSKMIGIK